MNKKNFALNVFEKKSFSLQVAGASITNTMKAIVKLAVKLSASATLWMRSRSNMKMSIKMTLAKFQQILWAQINGKAALKISAIAKLRYKVAASLKLATKIVATAKLRMKLNIASKIAIKIIASALAGQFYTLGYFDPSALSVVDSETLGDMDFHTV